MSCVMMSRIMVYLKLLSEAEWKHPAAWLAVVITLVFTGSAIGKPVLSEIIPAYAGRSAAWPLAFEVDRLETGRPYQLVLVNSSENAADRGMVVGYGQIPAGAAAGTRLFAESAWDESWRVLGAARAPDAPIATLTAMRNLPAVVTALLLEGELALSLGSMILPGALSDPGWLAPLRDAVTFGEDLTGAVPFASGEMIEITAGELGIRPWHLNAEQLDGWGVGPLIDGIVETERWGLRASPGVVNPVPYRHNPEPGTAAGLAVLAAVCLPGRARAGLIRRSV